MLVPVELISSGQSTEGLKLSWSLLERRATLLAWDYDLFLVHLPCCFASLPAGRGQAPSPAFLQRRLLHRLAVMAREEARAPFLASPRCTDLIHQRGEDGMDFSGVQAVHLPDSFSFVLQPTSRC